MPSDIAERLIEDFKAAAAEGAGLELRVRLLCGTIPTIAQHATAYRFEEVEAAVLSHFEPTLTSDERETFALTRQLRNKLFHADFHAVRAKLTIDGTIGAAGVRVAKLDEGCELEHLQELARSPESARAPIGDATSTAQGTVYGWLLEFGLSGEFGRAAQAFRKEVAIVDKLLAPTGKT
jgi:hypothetical protein